MADRCPRCHYYVDTLTGCPANNCPTFPRQAEAAPHPTPVQGEALPVLGDGYSIMLYPDDAKDAAQRVTVLGVFVADHAQATAEIARLQGEVERLLIKDRLASEAADESVRIELRLIAERDTLRTQLSDLTKKLGIHKDVL